MSPAARYLILGAAGLIWAFAGLSLIAAGFGAPSHGLGWLLMISGGWVLLGPVIIKAVEIGGRSSRRPE